MIKRELVLFLIVGALTVLLDFLTYTCLYRLDILSIGYAKAGGFLCGTIFAYFANRIWTFGHSKPISGAPLRFIVLYASTLGANVIVNSSVLFLLSEYAYKVLIAFILATAVSSCLNFFGMKFFVFREVSY